MSQTNTALERQTELVMLMLENPSKKNKNCIENLSRIGRPQNYSENYIQLLKSDYIRLLNKPYENEVTLTWQNPPLKCCQSLEILSSSEMGIDLLMLKIWGLQVNWLQSYQLSKLKFSRKSLPLQPFQPKCVQVQSARVRGRPGSNHSPKFDGRQLCSSPLTYRHQIFSI